MMKCNSRNTKSKIPLLSCRAQPRHLVSHGRIAEFAAGFLRFAPTCVGTSVEMTASGEGKFSISSLALLALLIVLPPSLCRAVEPWQEFAVWPTTDDQEMPAIHGDIAVWQQFVAEFGDYDVYVADIDEPDDALLFVLGEAGDQMNPDVYENVVVWQDSYFGDPDILAADIWRKIKPADFGVLLGEHEQTNPAVSGDVVVWQDNFSGDWDIYAARISDPNNVIEFPIATGKASQTRPAVDGNLIVWQDDRAGNWDIFGYNLTTGRRFRITDNPADQTNPAVSGNTVVWQDNREGNSQIYAVVLDGPPVAYCRTRLPGVLAYNV